MEDETKLIICKHNELIENFIFNATETELQILNYAVATTNPKWDNQNLVYRITIPDLVGTFKTKSNNAYKNYRDALSRLMKREYKYTDANGDDVIENLVTRIKSNSKDTSWLEFRFNDYISFRISNLKELFTQYDIKHIAMFRSRYAFAMYEFCKMHLQQIRYDDHYKKNFTIDKFREQFDLIGKYRKFADLEKRVLVPIKENINKHSDLTISYKVVRIGNTPVEIKFRAQYKKNHEPDSPAVDLKQQEEIPLEQAPKERTEAQTTVGKRALAAARKMLRTNKA